MGRTGDFDFALGTIAAADGKRHSAALLQQCALDGGSECCGVGVGPLQYLYAASEQLLRGEVEQIAKVLRDGLELVRFAE